MKFFSPWGFYSREGTDRLKRLSRPFVNVTMRLNGKTWRVSRWPA